MSDDPVTVVWSIKKCSEGSPIPESQTYCKGLANTNKWYPTAVIQNSHVDLMGSHHILLVGPCQSQQGQLIRLFVSLCSVYYDTLLWFPLILRAIDWFILQFLGALMQRSCFETIFTILLQFLTVITDTICLFKPALETCKVHPQTKWTVENVMPLLSLLDIQFQPTAVKGDAYTLPYISYKILK